MSGATGAHPPEMLGPAGRALRRAGEEGGGGGGDLAQSI
jgi:hypothetical protein